MRYVIKNGSSSVFNKVPRVEVFNNIANEVSELISQGNQVACVSSGAIAFGRAYLRISNNKNLLIPQKQALAAVGQNILMDYWVKAYKKHNKSVAQLLVTNEVLTGRLIDQKSHLIHTFEELFNLNIVPLINENDAVAIAEIVQGDNDNMSALIANMIDASVLILLGDIDGIYSDYPNLKNRIKTSNLQEEIKLLDYCKDSNSIGGTGGMKTKIQAAKLFLKENNEDNNKVVYIGSSKEKHIVENLVLGKSGTKLTLQ